MKTIIISGSRSPEGRTALLINALCEGIKEGGGETEVIFLPKMDISHCRQCNKDGWGICRDENRCIIQDDFQSIVERIDKMMKTIKPINP